MQTPYLGTRVGAGTLSSPAAMGAREPESETSFTCALCGFESRIDYIGNRPPWAPSVVFRERAYVLRDPTNAATNHPLCIGASCSVWCDGTAGPAQPLTLTPTRLPQLKGCLRRAGVLALLHAPALRGVPNSDGDPPRATRRASQGLIAGLRVIRDVDAEIGRARVRSAIDRRRRRRTIVLVDKVSISALRAGDSRRYRGPSGPSPGSSAREAERAAAMSSCTLPRARTAARTHRCHLSRDPADPPPMACRRRLPAAPQSLPCGRRVGDCSGCPVHHVSCTLFYVIIRRRSLTGR